MDLPGYIIKMVVIILACSKMVNGMVRANSFTQMVKLKKVFGKTIFFRINDYMSIFKYIK